MEIIVNGYLGILATVSLGEFLYEQFVFLSSGLIAGEKVENNLHLYYWVLAAWLYQTKVRKILPSLVVEILHSAVCYNFVSCKLKVDLFLLFLNLQAPTRIRLRVR